MRDNRIDENYTQESSDANRSHEPKRRQGDKDVKVSHGKAESPGKDVAVVKDKPMDVEGASKKERERERRT